MRPGCRLARLWIGPAVDRPGCGSARPWIDPAVDRPRCSTRVSELRPQLLTGSGPGTHLARGRARPEPDLNPIGASTRPNGLRAAALDCGLWKLLQGWPEGSSRRTGTDQAWVSRRTGAVGAGHHRRRVHRLLRHHRPNHLHDAAPRARRIHAARQSPRALAVGGFVHGPR